MSLGIVIVTFHCRELALTCLESIARHAPGALASTVVIDNVAAGG